MTTETTSRPTFLGIEIHGDICTSSRKEQRPMEEFAPLVQALLDDPTIAEFGWLQYTPYFNDGDTCEFSAHGAWVKLVDQAAPAAATEPVDEDQDDEDEDDEDEDRDRIDIKYDYQDRLGERDYTWEGEYPNRVRVDGGYKGPDEARHDRCRAFADAIDDGEFDDVLLSTFGDHAEIVVRRDGIQVDSYSHD